MRSPGFLMAVISLLLELRGLNSALKMRDKRSHPPESCRSAGGGGIVRRGLAWRTWTPFLSRLHGDQLLPRLGYL